jgi:hypothetical protein
MDKFYARLFTLFYFSGGFRRKKNRTLPNKFIYLWFVRFQVLTATSLKMAVSWDVAASILVYTDRRFREFYSLHHQGPGLFNDAAESSDYILRIS